MYVCAYVDAVKYVCPQDPLDPSPHALCVIIEQQSVYRSRQATQLVTSMKEEKGSSEVIQKRIRQHQAKKQVQHKFRTWARPFVVRIVKAEGLDPNLNCNPVTYMAQGKSLN